MAGKSREPFQLTGRYAERNRFENLNGPGDDRVTGRQIIADEDLVGKMSDKVMVVTGCSSGMGVETVRALALTGATIFGCARNLEKAKEALGSEILGTGRVHLVHMEMTNLSSVKGCAAEIRQKTSTLNVVVNNAAVMNTPEEKTTDGFELQFATNHLAHFLLFYLLKDLMLASSTPTFNSRVVNVSSAAHKYSHCRLDNINLEGEYNGWMAYGSSKTANMYMANEIDRLYGSKGLHGYSVHPGAFWSPNLQKHSQREMEAMNSSQRTRLYICSVEQACATSVYGAVSKELEGNGPYYLEGASMSVKQCPPDGDAVEYGYAAWAFDKDREEELWELSKKLCKVEEGAFD